VKWRAAVTSIVFPVLLLAAEAARAPWFGMSVRPHRTGTGQRYLHVERIVAAGPAERAGIRPGDLITTIGGAPLQYSDNLDVLLFLSRRRPGERLQLEVMRAGTARNMVLIVGLLPESARAGWERALEFARQEQIAAQRAR
jgi:putative serine protease PepD